MYDHRLFIRTISHFVDTLLKPYDVEQAMRELTSSVRDTLGLAGAGVTLVADGRLEFFAASPERVAAIERHMAHTQIGPCADAYATGETVVVADLSTRRHTWAQYCDVAESVGVRAVTGIPMRLDGEVVGALDIYADHVYEWSEEDLDAARVLAGMATSFIINATAFHRQEQRADQLQRALDSRVVIEQAKGALSVQRGMGVDEAFQVIRQYARSHNTSVHKVADAVVHLGLTL